MLAAVLSDEALPRLIFSGNKIASLGYAFLLRSTCFFFGGVTSQMFNQANLLRQAQALQERMQKAQEEVANLEITGESGAGMVKVTMTGNREVKRVSIDDSVMGEDKDVLEDLIAAAFNDAGRRVEEKSKELLGAVTAGIPLPPGMKLPF